MPRRDSRACGRLCLLASVADRRRAVTFSETGGEVLAGIEAGAHGDFGDGNFVIIAQGICSMIEATLIQI